MTIARRGICTVPSSIFAYFRLRLRCSISHFTARLHPNIEKGACDQQEEDAREEDPRQLIRSQLFYGCFHTFMLSFLTRERREMKLSPCIIPYFLSPFL